MKKVITIMLALLVAFSMTAFAERGSVTSGGNGNIMGQGKFPSDPHKIFRLVRYVAPDDSTDTAATLIVDSIVIWDCVSDDGVTVTTTTTSPDSAVAGIVAIAILTPDYGTIGWTAVQDLGRRNWGWLQTYGKAEVRINTTNLVAAGDAMGTSAVAGEADLFVASATESNKNGNAGFFYDAGAAAANDVECFVRCD